jgi:hypothetical protein
VKFDLGEELRRAWQITWTHKALWLFGMLPLLPVLFALPLLGYVFLSEDMTKELPRLLSNPAFFPALFILVLFAWTLSLVLQVFSTSATTSGLLRIEGGSQPTLRELIRGGRTFFWRILGVTLLGSLGTMALLGLLSGCLSLVGFATLGLGAVLGQLVTLPATAFIYVVLEQAQVASVAEGLRPVAAIQQAWDLVQEYIPAFALLALVLYFGMSIFSSVVMAPALLPLLLAVLGRFSGELASPRLVSTALLCFAVFLPLSLVLQAGARIFVESVFVGAYLRFRRSLNLQSLPEVGEAPS